MSSSTSRVMEYDPFSQEFQADPFPVYRWMRDEAPVFYSEKWNWWALSRFEDVRAAATDPQTFLSYEGIDIDDTAKDQSGPGFLPDIDNPRHDQIRRMVQPQLLPSRIAEREDAVRAVVRGLIDAWRHRGTVDLAQELAWPTPNEVFFDLLGLPAARAQGREQLKRWVHELKDRKPDDARLTPVAKAATAGIQAYFIDLLNERRRPPAHGPGDPHRHRRDRRRAVRRGAHRPRLGGPRPDDGAVPRRRGEHRGADRHAVQAARREPRPARDPAGEPGADPGRRRGGDPARHPAAAGRPHHVARGHAARGDDPGGRPGGAGLRRRQPRRAAVRRPRPLRRHPREAVPPPGLRRGHARLPRRAAGPAGGQDRAGGRRCRARRLHDRRRRRSATGPRRTCTSGTTCTWRSRSPRAPASTARTSRPCSATDQHDRGHPGVRGRRPGGGQGRGRGRRRRADPAADRRTARCPRGRRARTST